MFYGIYFHEKRLSFRPSILSIVLSILIAKCALGQQTNEVDSSNGPYISDREVENSFLAVKDAVSERKKLEEKLVSEGQVLDPKKRVADISLIKKSGSGPFIQTCDKSQLLFEMVTDNLCDKYNLTPKQRDEMLPKVQMKGNFGSKVQQECLQAIPSPQCNKYSKYRTADGSCNHLENPTLGSANTCFRRLLPAQYIRGSGLRESVLGGSLPPPRDLSNLVHAHLNRPTDYVTHMFMFFGQLLAHDISQAPISVTADNQEIECCSGTGQTHPQCAPIAIRPNDYFYSQFGTRCLNFVRSAVCPTCNLGARDQMNQITAFIDGSFIYGNSLNETGTLRSNDGSGRLRVESTPIGDLLPPSPDPLNDLCSFVNTSDICFQAGDSRANQHTTLTSLHTLFVREHNRLADGLRGVNPNWNDERIFQEARRIIEAQMQAITYKEWLPLTLGDKKMSYFYLWITNRGSTSYDRTIDPSLYNEFSGAAFRFGHSLINSVVTQTPRTPNNEQRLLRDEFFQPFELRNGIMGPLLSGTSNSPAQWFDRHLVPDVKNYLYRIRGSPAGLDLASFNIQRGRDHGLPTYTQVVRFCSEKQSDTTLVIRQFYDLSNFNLMTRSNAQLLEQNYRNVNDIDLWTGILSETPLEGAVVGPTAACIIGTQFNNLKFGDRFYFEHRNEAGSFTYQQMEELRKSTLSKIICSNTENRQIALNAFIFRSRNNPLIDCQYVKGIDLSYWKEW